MYVKHVRFTIFQIFCPLPSEHENKIRQSVICWLSKAVQLGSLRQVTYSCGGRGA